MKTEKIAVYSLTAILFSLMMLIYWLPKTKTWNTYNSGIEVLFILLLARAGGNIVMLIFKKKMSSHIAAGITALLLFPLLLIRSEALSAFVMFYTPVAALLIIYVFFKNRTHNSFMNFIKIIAAGISACILYFLMLYMYAKSNPGLSLGGDGGGGAWIFIAIGLGIFFIEISALSTNYALQKDEAKVEEKMPMDPVQTK